MNFQAAAQHATDQATSLAAQRTIASQAPAEMVAAAITEERRLTFGEAGFVPVDANVELTGSQFDIPLDALVDARMSHDSAFRQDVMSHVPNVISALPNSGNSSEVQLTGRNLELKLIHATRRAQYWNAVARYNQTGEERFLNSASVLHRETEHLDFIRGKESLLAKPRIERIRALQALPSTPAIQSQINSLTARRINILSRALFNLNRHTFSWLGLGRAGQLRKDIHQQMLTQGGTQKNTFGWLKVQVVSLRESITTLNTRLTATTDAAERKTLQDQIDDLNKQLKKFEKIIAKAESRKMFNGFSLRPIAIQEFNRSI
jgi:hypothetical protein